MTQARIPDEFPNGFAVTFVGGPADGTVMQRPEKPTVKVPSSNGGQFTYTLRRCFRADGRLVEVLAPAGRPIDPNFLKINRLKN